MRALLQRSISFGIVISWGFMAWKLLTCLSQCEPPLTIIFYGSMGPAFYKGDLLLVYKNKTPIECGEIVMFKVDEVKKSVWLNMGTPNASRNYKLPREGLDGSAPIVHRVIKVTRQLTTGEVDLLTKGDNNLEDDRGNAYGTDIQGITLENLVGSAVWYLPYIGWPVILVMMKNYVKYPLAGAMTIWLLKPRPR